MMRSALAALIIAAFALTATVTLSAEPRYLVYGNQVVITRDWVGHTRGQLIRQMGTPDSVVRLHRGGERIRFVKPMFLGRGNQVLIVEQFEVSSNGRILSVSVYRM